MKIGKKNVVSRDILDYNIGLIGESGVGKEQPVSEPVLTEEGWVEMGNIEIGTKVYGEDGNLHNVVGVYPQGVKDVYEVTFNDGTKTRCGLDHLWDVTTKKQRENNRKYKDYRHKIISLKEIMLDYKGTRCNKSHPKGLTSYKYSIPINKPIKFDAKKIKIEPYLLGLLLGDGGFTGSVITFTNNEEDIYEEIKKEIKDYNIELRRRFFENHYQAIFAIKDGCKNNELRKRLKEYGLLGCGSREKFIPCEYLYNSIENRAALLSGIINTDGHISKNFIQVSTYSNQLARDVAELGRSLGFICCLHEYDRTDENSCKKYEKEIEYRISIIGDDYSMLNLSKKHQLKLSQRTKQVSHVKSIVNIQKIGKEECQCIMTDNPSHLYITKNYIVTHNTTIIKQVVEKLLNNLEDPAEGYLFIEANKEDGADAIEGINYVSCPSWKQGYEDDNNTIGFATLVDDIIDNKDTDYPDLRVVVVDTYDELRKIAEKEVVRLHNKDHEKKIKTIKAAFGGFMAGDDMADDMILDKLWELKSVGVHFVIIGHTKMRTSEDEVAEEKYSQLTTDMSLRSFNKIKNKLHFLGVAYKNRTFAKSESNSKTKKIETETRKICFRDDDFCIDSKSRFADIINEIDFDADMFIQAMQDAIDKEIAKSGKSKKEIDKEQKEKKEAQRRSETKAKEQKIDPDKNQEYINLITETISEMSKEEKKASVEFMKDLKGEYGFKTFADLIDFPTLQVEEIYKKFLDNK